jgi:hypothetical protein
MSVADLRRSAGLVAVVATLLSACDTQAETSIATSTTARPTTTTAIAAPPIVATPVVKKWVELNVGDCLVDPPPSDPAVVTVAIVDCAQPHAAEVFSRAPLAVNTALADVADRECAEGFVRYTGQAIDGSRFTLTYLIDSNQDRTSDNPNPSSVICLLEAGDGGPLTTSARR